MLCYEMLTGLPPWYTRDRKKLYERLRSAPLVFPDFVEPVARDFLGGLLTRNPALRLGARGGSAEVQAHPFFAGIDFGALFRREVPPPFAPQLRTSDVGAGDVRYFDDQVRGG